MGILEGVKWHTSRAAYNGPKQQWYTDIIPKIRQRFWLHMLIAEPRENIVWDFPPFETDIIFILVSQGEDWSHFRRNLAAKAGTILWIWIASIYIFLTAFGYIFRIVKEKCLNSVARSIEKICWLTWTKEWLMSGIKGWVGEDCNKSPIMGLSNAYWTFTPRLHNII